MTHQFVPYPSTSTFTKEWLEEYIYPYYKDEPSYVTEKIHGKSMTIDFDGTTFNFGRRKDWIQSGDKFGDISSIQVVLEARIERMYINFKAAIEEHYLAADHAVAEGAEDVTYPDVPRDFKHITLRGELFGGSYNHPDVPRIGGMTTIKSSGISYSQELSYSVYRIEIDGEPLDFHAMGMLCLSYKIPHVPVLFIGTLMECVEWSQANKEADTTLPLGFPLCTAEGEAIPHSEVDGMFKALPKIENNLREGHVIAPKKPITLPNGKSLILKDKNDKFIETKYEKTPKPEVDPLAGEIGKVYAGILPKLTVARFHNIQSHNHDFGKDEFQKAAGLVVQDAIDEYMLEASEDSIIWVGLTLHEKKTLTKRLNATCCERLKAMFFSDK